ncbi:MAG: hypothetical protein JXP34_15110, partial [Planctomycetes bacterium]|nr:hypothetical protein [Planctomycetota bacterium]
AWRLDPRSGWQLTSDMREEEIERRDVEIRGGSGVATFVPPRPGQYIAQVRAPQGDHIAEDVFGVDSTRDWSPDSFPSPARARITLDRPRYRPGDIARARVAAPFGGLALLSVEGDRIHDLFVRPLPEGTGEFEIPIRSTFGPNVYVTASIVRSYAGANALSKFPHIDDPEPLAPAAGPTIAPARMPYPVLPAGEAGTAAPAEAEFRAVPASYRGEGSAPGAGEAASGAAREPRGSGERREPPIPIELLPFRAIGATPLLVDPSQSALQVRVHVPEKARPGEPVEAQIFVAGPDGRPVEAEVSLALVDEGILALTGMETPDPIGHYFAKRRLETSLADVYSQIVPPVRGATPAGGGWDEEEQETSRRRLTQPIDVRRIRPVALWISPLRTSPEGLAFARFEAPELDGRLRAMAVAASREAVGSSESGIVIRRPLVAKPTFPRFLACGDHFTVPVPIFNDTGEGGEVRVTLRAEGAARVAGDGTRTAAIDGDGEAIVRLEAEAGILPGAATFVVEAEIGAARIEKTVEIPVRPALPSTRRSRAGIVRAGETIPIDPGFEALPGTGDIEIRLSGSPLTELSPAIQSLRGYPYGCAEQTASRVIALTALTDPMLSDENELAEVLPLIATGVDRLLSMQVSAGGLSLWPGGRWPCPWVSVYAADVLCQVRRAGQPVDDNAFEDLIDYAEDLVLKREENIATRAYAAYVSILAGKGEIADIERLSEEDLSDAARFFVAMALRRAGQLEAARRLIREAEVHVPAGDEQRPPNPETFGSGIRDDAIVLLGLLEIEPEAEAIPRLVERIRAAASDEKRWHTTQENAFAVLALSAYARAQGFGKGAFHARILAGDRPIGEATETRPIRRVLPIPDGGALAIACEGSPAYWSCVAQGVPAGGKAETFDRGITVRRRILDWQGEPAPEVLAQGESYVIEISLSSPRWLQNVVIEDLLPAGLEIENPRFETTDAELRRELRDRLLRPDSVEMRDDRLLLFTGYAPDSSSRPRFWRYVVRAVTAGTFAVPPIRASCMYEGGIESASGDGTLTVEG